MNTTRPLFRLSLLAAAVIASGCASTPRVNSEVARLQDQLRDMRADERIAPYAAAELRDAEVAVAFIADQRRMRAEDFDQNLYLAGRLVNIAGAEGLARYATKVGQDLDRERESMLVDARTREADNARRLAQNERLRADDAQLQTRIARSDADLASRDANQARQQAEQDRMDAERGQREADLARGDAADARQQAERDRMDAERGQRDVALARNDASQARADAEAARQQLQQMQVELADLNAKQTERGLVVTVGDVLFEVDRAELRPGARRELDKLANALGSRTGFDLAIEGHTDSTGSTAYNQDLSERRAESVRTYLAQKGISGDRLSSIGLGQDQPVASNETASGRQQNRRVEIVIQQPEPARVSSVEGR